MNVFLALRDALRALRKHKVLAHNVQLVQLHRLHAHAQVEKCCMDLAFNLVLTHMMLRLVILSVSHWNMDIGISKLVI